MKTFETFYICEYSSIQSQNQATIIPNKLYQSLDLGRLIESEEELRQELIILDRNPSLKTIPTLHSELWGVNISWGLHGDYLAVKEFTNETKIDIYITTKPNIENEVIKAKFIEMVKDMNKFEDYNFKADVSDLSYSIYFKATQNDLEDIRFKYGSLFTRVHFDVHMVFNGVHLYTNSINSVINLSIVVSRINCIVNKILV